MTYIGRLSVTMHQVKCKISFLQHSAGRRSIMMLCSRHLGRGNLVNAATTLAMDTMRMSLAAPPRRGLLALVFVVVASLVSLDIEKQAVLAALRTKPLLNTELVSRDQGKQPKDTVGRNNVTRELCSASASLTQHTEKEKGDRYFLVGASHDLETAVMTDAAPVVAFLFHRSSSSNETDPCSPFVLEAANMLLNERKDLPDTLPKIPISQSVFLQVYLDHRHFGVANTTGSARTQTRRSEIDVHEIAPDYFYFATNFSKSSGIAVLSLEVALESRERRFVIPLDTIGAPYNCSVANHSDDDAVVEQVRFRYQLVVRFGILVQAGPLELDTIHREDDDDRPCDYSDGRGEWVFELKSASSENEQTLTLPIPDSVLSSIADAPFRNATKAQYRLFSCSPSTLNQDFEYGKNMLAQAQACSQGDSNFQRMEVFFKRLLPNFYNEFYFFLGPDVYARNGRVAPISQPPRCRWNDTDVTDVMIVDHGGHCPAINLPAAATAYDQVNPSLPTQAKCVLGIDELEPYAKRCPAKFGDIERLRRNVWRVSAKNRVGRTSYARNNIHVGALDPMALSIRDVSMKGEDCVHYASQDPFPIYAEAVKFMIALAGRHCAL